MLKAHYLIGKTKLPAEISAEIAVAVNELSKTTDRAEYLRRAYDLLTARYDSHRFSTYLRFNEIFAHGAEDLWNRSGFLHCTNQNFLLALLLVKSGLFEEADIQPRWTLVWYISPHQYMRVRVGEDEYIDVDCWCKDYGIPFGSYAHGFNSSFKKVG